MENYNVSCPLHCSLMFKILRKLGKGAQGSVFLCEDKATHVNYVMKKVECNDEAEANKAFKEVGSLDMLWLAFI